MGGTTRRSLGGSLAKLIDASGSRRAHNRSRFPSHPISPRSCSIHYNTCCLLRADNRMPGGHICCRRSLPYQYSLVCEVESMTFILKLGNATVKAQRLRNLAHNDCTLSLAKIQNHRFVQLNRILFTINADYQIRGSCYQFYGSQAWRKSR